GNPSHDRRHGTVQARDRYCVQFIREKAIAAAYVKKKEWIMQGRRDEERVTRIQDALKGARLDAVVCALPENVLLLSGYWPVVGNALAIATREGRVAVIAPEDERDLAEAGWADDIRTFQPAPLDAI